MPKKQSESVGEISTVAISGEMLRDKIYIIRGQRVMLDSDLAEIYGYTTSAFNQQVKNNIEKFEGEDFMFRLTKDDLISLSMSKNLISISQNVISMQTKGMKGGRAKMPYAFTEQGIYMLMTVLRGPLAIQQSRILIRLFKTMKDYVIANQAMLEYKDNLQLAKEVMTNARELTEVKEKFVKLDGEVAGLDSELRRMSEKLSDTITRSEISPIMLDFNKVAEQKEFVFLNGEPMRANELYIDIYAEAKKSIMVIDDYISIKTLRQLQKVKRGVEVVVFSDNKGNYLHRSDYLDFVREYPEMKVKFVRTEGLVHDRFIIIDYRMKNEAIYHCGSSAKDAGGKIAAMSKFEDELVKGAMREVVERLKGNRGLGLR